MFSRKEIEAIKMIHLPKNRRAQVRYLLDQSSQGNHVLFEPVELRRAFERSSGRLCPLTEAEAYETEPHIERLLQEPSLERKRAYLAGLAQPEFDRVVMTYFSILENNLFESTEVRH